MTLMPLIVGAALLGLFFGLLWLAITLLQRRSPWSRVARCYPYRPPTPAARNLGDWCLAGPRTQGLTRVRADDQGMYFEVFIAYRVFGSPNLFVPWSEIHSVGSKRWLGSTFSELRFRKAQDVPFLFWADKAAELARMAGHHWPAPPA